MRFALAAFLLVTILSGHAHAQYYGGYGYHGQYNPYSGYGYRPLNQNHHYAQPGQGYPQRHGQRQQPRHMQAMNNGGFYAIVQGGYLSAGDQEFDYSPGNQIDTELDGGYALGLAAGYDFGHLIGDWLGVRTELEYTYRSNDVDTHTLNGAAQTGESGDVASHGFMWNGYFDWYAHRIIRPYVGVGIGLASVNYKDYGVAAIPTVLDDGDAVFAYQGIIGSAFNVTDKFSIMADYRYFGTADPEVTTASPNNTDVEYDTHNFLVGLRYAFY